MMPGKNVATGGSTGRFTHMERCDGQTLEAIRPRIPPQQEVMFTEEDRSVPPVEEAATKMSSLSVLRFPSRFVPG